MHSSQADLLLQHLHDPPHHHSLSLSLSPPPKSWSKMPRIVRSTSDTLLPGPQNVSSPPRPSHVIHENKLRYRGGSVDESVYHLTPISCPSDAHPDHIFTLSFLAEGAANAVFRIKPYIHSIDEFKGPGPIFLLMKCQHGQWKPLPHDKVQGKVLRISKGVPKTLPFRDIVHGFNTVIRPMFKATGEEGIEQGEQSDKQVFTSSQTTSGSAQVMPKTHSQALPDKLHASRNNGVANGHSKCTATNNNASKSFESFLMDDEGVDFNVTAARHLHTLMHGTACGERGKCDRVPNMELRGILLPDMSSVPDKFLTIELKPKWLAQSPTAPRNAFKCRTCALQARRTSLGKSPPVSYICPLQLVAGNEKAIAKFLRPRITEEVTRNVAMQTDPLLLAVEIETLLKRTTEYLARGPGHDLLEFLRKLQMEHDNMGVTQQPREGKEEFDRRLRVAMTLRDCSLFIRVPYQEDEDAHIEGKLGDLDYKSQEKINDWKMKETALINGGWYTKLDKTAGGEHRCAIAERWRKGCSWYV